MQDALANGDWRLASDSWRRAQLIKGADANTVRLTCFALRLTCREIKL